MLLWNLAGVSLAFHPCPSKACRCSAGELLNLQWLVAVSVSRLKVPCCVHCTILQLGASFFFPFRLLWVVELQQGGGVATQSSPGPQRVQVMGGLFCEQQQ